MTEDNSPLQRFEDALEERIKNYHAIFSSQNPENFDLSGLQSDMPRTIQVEFLRPAVDLSSYMEMMASITRSFTVTNPGMKNDMQDVLLSKYAETFGENAPRSWTTTKQEGSVTLECSEKIIETGTPFSLTLSFRVDGVRFDREYLFRPKDHFTEIVKLVDAFHTVQQDTPFQLHPNITISNADGLFMTQTRDEQLVLCKDFFPYAKGQAPEFYETILRHERKHILDKHEPFETAITQLKEDVEPLAALFQSASAASTFPDLPPTKPDQRIFCTKLAAILGSKEAIENWFGALEHELADSGELSGKIRDVAARVQAFPGFDGLDALMVAADTYRDNAFAKSIVTMSPKDASTRFTRETIKMGGITPVESGQADILPDPALVGIVQEKMDALPDRHAELYANVQTLDRALQLLRHAREIRCDFHAAEHTENPTAAASLFLRVGEMQEAGDGGLHLRQRDSRTHPSPDGRAENIEGSFAEAVLEARKQTTERGRG